MKPISWVKVPFEVDKRFEGFRVDRFLAQRLTAYSRSRVQKILAEARVTRDDRLLKASAKVHSGEQIVVVYPKREEKPLLADAAIPILYEDDSLLVVDKPANLLSHPTDKVVDHTVLGLLRHCRPDLKQLHLFHRLDRETSGILALGKTLAAARAWGRLMDQRQVHKTYLALVRGVPSPRSGTLRSRIGPQGGTIRVRQWVNVPGAVAAVTRYEVVRSVTPHTGIKQPSFPRRRESSGFDVRLRGNDDRGNAAGSPLTTAGMTKNGRETSIIRLSPETGRLHQIRVHLAALGHPLLGDVLYNGDGEIYLKMTEGQDMRAAREQLGFPRLALHAAQLRFPHPLTSKTLNLSAPLPPDFREFLQDYGISKIDTLTSR